jgi:hypothetical protein
MYKIRIKNSPSDKKTGDQEQYGLVRNLSAMQTSPEQVTVNDKMGAVPREEANIEVEGGESVIGDVNQDGVMELMHFVGKRHHEGGVPVNIPEGSFIYSDTKKLTIKDPEILEKIFNLPPRKKGYTPAEISKKYDINQYVQILKDESIDEMTKRSAAEMLKKNKQKLGILAFIQESMKGFPDGIPTIAEEVLGSLGISAESIMQKASDNVAQQQQQMQQMQMPPQQMPPMEGEQMMPPPQMEGDMMMPPMNPEEGMMPPPEMMGKFGGTMKKYQAAGTVGGIGEEELRLLLAQREELLSKLDLLKSDYYTVSEDNKLRQVPQLKTPASQKKQELEIAYYENKIKQINDIISGVGLQETKPINLPETQILGNRQGPFMPEGLDESIQMMYGALDKNPYSQYAYEVMQGLHPIQEDTQYGYYPGLGSEKDIEEFISKGLIGSESVDNKIVLRNAVKAFKKALSQNVTDVNGSITGKIDGNIYYNNNGEPIGKINRNTLLAYDTNEPIGFINDNNEIINTYDRTTIIGKIQERDPSFLIKTAKELEEIDVDNSLGIFPGSKQDVVSQNLPSILREELLKNVNESLHKTLVNDKDREIHEKFTPEAMTKKIQDLIEHYTKLQEAAPSLTEKAKYNPSISKLERYKEYINLDPEDNSMTVPYKTWFENVKTSKVINQDGSVGTPINDYLLGYFENDSYGNEDKKTILELLDDVNSEYDVIFKKNISEKYKIPYIQETSYVTEDEKGNPITKKNRESVLVSPDFKNSIKQNFWRPKSVISAPPISREKGDLFSKNNAFTSLDYYKQALDNLDYNNTPIVRPASGGGSDVNTSRQELELPEDGSEYLYYVGNVGSDDVNKNPVYLRQSKKDGYIEEVSDSVKVENLNKAFAKKYGEAFMIKPATINVQDTPETYLDKLKKQNSSTQNTIQTKIGTTPRQPSSPIVNPQSNKSSTDILLDQLIEQEDVNRGVQKQFGGQINTNELLINKGNKLFRFGGTIDRYGKVLKKYNLAGTVEDDAPVEPEVKKEGGPPDKVKVSEDSKSGNVIYKQTFSDGTVWFYVNDKNGKQVQAKNVQTGKVITDSDFSATRGNSEWVTKNNLSPWELKHIQKRWNNKPEIYLTATNSANQISMDQKLKDEMFKRFQNRLSVDAKDGQFTLSNFADKRKQLQDVSTPEDLVRHLLAQDDRNYRLESYGLKPGVDNNPTTVSDPRYSKKINKSAYDVIKANSKPGEGLDDLDYSKDAFKGQAAYIAYVDAIENNEDLAKKANWVATGQSDETGYKKVYNIATGNVSLADDYHTDTTLKEKTTYNLNPPPDTEIEKKTKTNNDLTTAGKVKKTAFYCVEFLDGTKRIENVTYEEGTPPSPPQGANIKAAVQVQSANDVCAPDYTPNPNRKMTDQSTDWFAPDVVNFATALGQRVPFTPPTLRTMPANPLSGYDLKNPITQIAGITGLTKQQQDLAMNTMDPTVAFAATSGLGYDQLAQQIGNVESQNVDIVNRYLDNIGQRQMAYDQFNTQARRQYDVDVAVANEERARDLNRKDAVTAQMYGQGFKNMMNDNALRVEYPNAWHVNRPTGVFGWSGVGRDPFEPDTSYTPVSNRGGSDNSYQQSIDVYNDAYRTFLQQNPGQDTDAKKHAEDIRRYYLNQQKQTNMRGKSQQSMYNSGVTRMPGLGASYTNPFGE